MIITYYDPITGQILSVADAQNEHDILVGEAYAEGRYDGATCYIDTESKLPVLFPKKPINTRHKYSFDWVSKEWKVDIALTERMVRQMRDRLFQPLDKMNPIWYDCLSEEQKQQLKDYRKSLLDITKQPDYPLDVTFPAIPNFL
jgi:hypothetical protein